MASTSQKNKRARIPKFRTKSGEYLALQHPSGRDNKVYIAWFLPEEGDFGLVAGQGEGSADLDENSKTVCDTLAKHFADRGWKHKLGTAYSFESEKYAAEALRLCNVALHCASEQKPLPDWAAKAIAEGFTPPRGWKS
jgi:hypothetical protein